MPTPTGPSASIDSSGVKAWIEPITLPTYKVGSPDPNPIFYARESYQGAQKRVYPYPLQDDLTHARENQDYTALHLENEYLSLMVLPEIGGRLFAATDKTNGYELFYRQHVIKPALIGMLGAWISGGVEWCAFHHHRNTTFMPVDWRITEDADGGRTIWLGETERRHRMRWLIGLTLRPGVSCIETTVRLFNRTPQPHSILYWANAAVAVDETYQVIFPPSVQVAAHHSKIDFTHWPVSKGRYLGHDLTGVDLSWWKNATEPNSFFAWNLQEDFMGGYDHGRRAGVVHVGDHHLVCGAKLWEWGTGPSGRRWDRILSDDDRPYVELMIGAWSDNQPDYSWIKPHEVKEIRQYWFPVREIGGFKNASLRGAVNLELGKDNTALFGFHTTSKHARARAVLTAKGRILREKTVDIGPDRPFRGEVSIPGGTAETDLRAVLFSANGEELLAYQPIEHKPVEALPAPVKPPPKPADIGTVEELYLTGLRIEQIHNPRINPDDYYREALRRDPGDTRSNIALGIRCNKRGLREEAEAHLRTAIRRLAADYTRPRDTEAYYQLGLALRAGGRIEDAREDLYRATWDQALRAAAYHQLAELSCRQGRYAQALEEINRSIASNAPDTRARNIKAMILRRLGRPADARATAGSVLAEDPLDFFAANEQGLSERALRLDAEAAATLGALHTAMRGEVQSFLELACDYAACGAWDEAIEVLQRPVDAKTPFASTYPELHYWLGYLHECRGDREAARTWYARAAALPSDFCFPYRLETADALRAAIRANPGDARAHYYLGNLLYDLQPENATACWEEARRIDAGFAMVHRNLGWAAWRVRNDITRAIHDYESAVARNPRDPRLFLELDTLYEIGNVAPERRREVLEGNHEVVRRRQDSLLREIMVLVLTGRYDRAIEYLDQNRFHAREGAEQIRDVYVDAQLLAGTEDLRAGRPAEALRHFERATDYPDNLAIGRRTRDPRGAEMSYREGMACDALGLRDKALACYRRGAEQHAGPFWPVARYCQALCLQKCGRGDEAAAIFDELREAGAKRLAEGDSADYFAKFGEEETSDARAAAARLTIGLGHLGQGQAAEARREFEQAVSLDGSNVWARFYLTELEGP